MIDENTIIIGEGNNSGVSGKRKKCNVDIDSIDKGYECSFCNDKYHKRCISQSSYCDISLNIGILFICNTCENSINIEK